MLGACITIYSSMHISPKHMVMQVMHEETGHQRKLFRPWHGPYRITDRRDPDLRVSKGYFPQDGTMQVHQSRVCPWPAQFPAGYYWYWGKQRGPGRHQSGWQTTLSRINLASFPGRTNEWPGTHCTRFNAHARSINYSNRYTETYAE